MHISSDDLDLQIAKYARMKTQSTSLLNRTRIFAHVPNNFPKVVWTQTLILSHIKLIV